MTTGRHFYFTFQLVCAELHSWYHHNLTCFKRTLLNFYSICLCFKFITSWRYFLHVPLVSETFVVGAAWLTWATWLLLLLLLTLSPKHWKFLSNPPQILVLDWWMRLLLWLLWSMGCILGLLLLLLGHATGHQHHHGFKRIGSKRIFHPLEHCSLCQGFLVQGNGSSIRCLHVDAGCRGGTRIRGDCFGLGRQTTFNLKNHQKYVAVHNAFQRMQAKHILKIQSKFHEGTSWEHTLSLTCQALHSRKRTKR